MGIDYHAAALLTRLRQNGVSFGRVLTIGRQNLFLSPGEHARLARNHALPHHTGPAFAEGFLEGLGASQVDSIDASSYEAATIVHDMNNPVPGAWHERYDRCSTAARSSTCSICRSRSATACGCCGRADGSSP